MSSKIELIVFDMAGTTVLDRREVEQCFFEAIRQTDLQTSHSEINAMMGRSKITVFETLWRRRRPNAGEELIQEKIQQSFSLFKRILENYYRTQPVYSTPGTLELFGYLQRKGIKIALTTGFYREVADIILQRLGWDADDSPVSSSVSSDQVCRARPAPFMVFRAMEQCGVDNVRRVIKIGDTPSDIAEGKNAGCYLSCGITNGTHSRDELQACQPDALFDDMYHFRSFLENEIG